MAEMQNFDIDLFHKSVVQKYFELKKFKDLESDYIKSVSIGSKKKGSLLARIFFNIATAFGDAGFRESSTRLNAVEFEKKSKFLLAQNKIQETLCAFLSSSDREETLTEEQTIKIIINSIAEDALRKEFSIKLEPELFAFLTYELLQIGITNYCNKVTEEIKFS